MTQMMMSRRRIVPWSPSAPLSPPHPAHAQSPPDAETRFSTGLIHLREGRVDLAVEEFKQAVKEDDKNPYFQKGLGLAYARKRKCKDAIEAFRKALEINPYYVDVRNDLGMALIAPGKREDGQEGVPDRLLGSHEPDARDLLPQPRPSLPRGEELRRGDQLVPDEPRAGTRSTPTPTWAWPRRWWAPGHLEEAVAQLEAGVTEVPADPGLPPRAGPGPASRPAASPRRAPSSRRR